MKHVFIVEIDSNDERPDSTKRVGDSLGRELELVFGDKVRVWDATDKVFDHMRGEIKADHRH